MNKTLRQFQAALSAAQFNVIASGSRAAVWAKDGVDGVFKTCDRSYDGWPQYINWAAGQGELGGLAPLVKVMRPCLGGGYIAFMERLDSVAYAEYQPIENGIWNCPFLDKLYMDLPHAYQDHHHGNLMKRPSTGQYVFADAISSYNGPGSVCSQAGLFFVKGYQPAMPRWNTKTIKVFVA